MLSSWHGSRAMYTNFKLAVSSRGGGQLQGWRSAPGVAISSRGGYFAEINCTFQSRVPGTAQSLTGSGNTLTGARSNAPH